MIWLTIQEDSSLETFWPRPDGTFEDLKCYHE
jgi:hypothetical protein